MLKYRIFSAYFQCLKCLFTSFLMPTYNILKIYNGLTKLEIISQIDCLICVKRNPNRIGTGLDKSSPISDPKSLDRFLPLLRSPMIECVEILMDDRMQQEGG